MCVCVCVSALRGDVAERLTRTNATSFYSPPVQQHGINPKLVKDECCVRACVCVPRWWYFGCIILRASACCTHRYSGEKCTTRACECVRICVCVSVQAHTFACRWGSSPGSFVVCSDRSTRLGRSCALCEWRRLLVAQFRWFCAIACCCNKSPDWGRRIIDSSWRRCLLYRMLTRSVRNGVPFITYTHTEPACKWNQYQTFD